MRYFWKGLKHFFSSNSRHGTHSPFVYRLADEVVYAKGRLYSEEAGRSQRLIADIVEFLALEVTTDINERGKGKALLTSVINIRDKDIVDLQQEYGMLILTDIYKKPSYEHLWKEVVRSSDVIVSIDFFHFGLVCYRKEQAKETFKLRFPYWR